MRPNTNVKDVSMKWPVRGLASTAASVALLSVAGLSLGVPPAEASVGGKTNFVCTTATGIQKVTARIDARAPSSVESGEPLPTGEVSMTLAMTETAAAALLRSEGDRSTVASGLPGDSSPELIGSAHLQVSAAQEGRTEDAGWPTFSLKSVGAADAGQGEIVLRGAATAPALTWKEPGTVSWRAGRLVLVLSSPSDVNAKGAVVACTPESGSFGLGTAKVLPSAASDVRGAAPIPEADTPSEDPQYPCGLLPEPGEPGGGFNPDKQLSSPPTWPGYEMRTPGAVRPGTPFCARVAGFGNLTKLGAAMPVAGEAAIRINVQSQSTQGYSLKDPAFWYLRSNGYALSKLEPTKLTALGFGFMPTTVTAEVSQVPTEGANGSQGSRLANLYTSGSKGENVPQPFPNETMMRQSVGLAVQGASVNGVPLNIGTHCRTGPTYVDVLAFQGDDKVGRFIPQKGGTYTGRIDVPAFSGCGAGEDLSPLLNATSQSNGNYVKLESSIWCPGDVECAERVEPRTWTVRPGGVVTATAKPFIIDPTTSADPEAKIYCKSAKMVMNMAKGTYNSRYQVGEVTDFVADGCRREPNGGQVKFTAYNLPWSINVGSSYEGVWGLDINGGILEAAGRENNEKCVIRLGGASFRYDDAAERPARSSFSLSRDGQTMIHESAVGQPFVSTPQTDCPSSVIGFAKNMPALITGSGFTVSPPLTLTVP